jgi:hypothetical protein
MCVLRGGGGSKVRLVGLCEVVVVVVRAQALQSSDPSGRRFCADDAAHTLLAHTEGTRVCLPSCPRYRVQPLHDTAAATTAAALASARAARRNQRSSK